jgi:hypothetical protein
MADTTPFMAVLGSSAKAIPINIAANGENTVHTTTAGKRFVIYNIWLQAEAACEVTFRSKIPAGASTDISGAINFAAAAERGWISSGVPIFRGNAVGDNFVIFLNGAFQVNGFALVGEISV